MAALYFNDFEAGLGSGIFANTNCSVAQDTSAKINGAGSWRLTSTAAGGMDAFKDQVEFPSGTVTRTMRCLLRKTGTARNCFITIIEYDNVGVEIGRNTSGTVSVNETPILFSISRTMSGFGGAHVDLFVTMGSAAAGGETLYVDDLAYNEGTDDTAPLTYPEFIGHQAQRMNMANVYRM